MEGGRRGLGHKREIRTGSIGVHRFIGGLVVPQLAHHIAKYVRQEISAKNYEALVIGSHEARIQENGLFYVLK